MNLTEGTKGWFTPHGGGERKRAEVIKVWGPQCVNLRCEDGTLPSSVLIKQTGCTGYFFEPDQVDATEQLICDKGANVAPRVTKDDVLAEIVGESYTVLPSGRVTVCELTLRNGFTVRGESAVVFIENFNAEIGRKVARENAESQVWQLLGFLLRHGAAGAATTEGQMQQLRTELGRAYRCIKGMHNALTTLQAEMPGNGYHLPTVAAANRFVFEDSLDGTDYFIGKPVDVLHAALALPGKG